MTDKERVREVMDKVRKMVQLLRSSHRAAKGLNITGAQLFVISILSEADGPMSVKDLAELTQTDQSTVSVVVGRLVDNGLVHRARSVADARKTELSLTPAGREIRRKAPVTVAQKRLAEALAKLSSHDLSALGRTLSTLLEEMGGDSLRPGMMFDDRPAARSRGTGRSKRR